MDISPSQSLSFKQARLAVLIAFVLGALASLLQVSLDYVNEDASIDREMSALLEISDQPAARIAYNIDSELARELVTGLLRSPAVIYAAIVDNRSVELSSASRPPRDSDYRLLSDLLFGERRVFERELRLDPSETLGWLRIEVDTYAFGSHFLRRSGLTLLAGFARTLALTVILLVLFQLMLTQPLKRVIEAIADRDLNRPGQPPLPCPHGHERDEIGVLVRVANRQFDSMAEQMNQRQQAEQRLTRYLSELENIVSARTAELKSANESLTLSNRELEQARAQALETAQARSAFLAHMSHEIRTPLNGVLGMLELSLASPLPPAQRQQLKVAHDSGKMLVELLNDILDLSKFEAGQLELEALDFDPAALVEETASLLSQNAAPGVELSCLIAADVPGQVRGDPTRFRQILINLLSNALKFTHQGRVEVWLERLENDGLRLRVRDTGIGIAPEQQQRIFEPFAQATAGITRQYGGTGLGLALTLRLCEAMQGRLRLFSETGRGSEFIAELPLPTQAAATELAPLHGRIGALLEADSGSQRMLAAQLPRWGLDYQRIDSPEQATAIEADLFVCASAEQARALRAHHTQPLLLIGAYADLLPSDEAEALAPLRQLARPISRAALHAAIAASLAQDDGESTHTAAAPAGDEQPSARILLVEDNHINQLVAKGMLEKLGHRVTLADNGARALEALQHAAFDLVLMDCNMPVMDGYEASRKIRADAQWKELPIIALTANALLEERERCRAAGMDDYLAKPFRREELVSLLDRWLAAIER